MGFTPENAREMSARGKAAKAAKKTRQAGVGDVLSSSARRKKMESEVWYCATHEPSKDGKEKNELRRLLMEMKSNDPQAFMAYLRDWLPKPPKEQPLPPPQKTEAELNREAMGDTVGEYERWMAEQGHAADGLLGSADVAEDPIVEVRGGPPE